MFVKSIIFTVSYFFTGAIWRRLCWKCRYTLTNHICSEIADVVAIVCFESH